MREKQTIICIIENVFVYKLCGLNWRTKIDTQFGVTFMSQEIPGKRKLFEWIVVGAQQAKAVSQEKQQKLTLYTPKISLNKIPLRQKHKTNYLVLFGREIISNMIVFFLGIW